MGLYDAKCVKSEPRSLMLPVQCAVKCALGATDQQGVEPEQETGL